MSIKTKKISGTIFTYRLMPQGHTTVVDGLERPGDTSRGLKQFSIVFTEPRLISVPVGTGTGGESRDTPFAIHTSQSDRE